MSVHRFKRVHHAPAVASAGRGHEPGVGLAVPVGILFYYRFRIGEQFVLVGRHAHIQLLQPILTNEVPPVVRENRIPRNADHIAVDGRPFGVILRNVFHRLRHVRQNFLGIEQLSALKEGTRYVLVGEHHEIGLRAGSVPHADSVLQILAGHARKFDRNVEFLLQIRFNRILRHRLVKGAGHHQIQLVLLAKVVIRIVGSVHGLRHRGERRRENQFLDWRSGIAGIGRSRACLACLRHV